MNAVVPTSAQLLCGTGRDFVQRRRSRQRRRRRRRRRHLIGSGAPLRIAQSGGVDPQLVRVPLGAVRPAATRRPGRGVIIRNGRPNARPTMPGFAGTHNNNNNNNNNNNKMKKNRTS